MVQVEKLNITRTHTEIIGLNVAREKELLRTTLKF